MSHKADLFDQCVERAKARGRIMSATNVKANGELRTYVWNPLDTSDIKGTGHPVKSEDVKTHKRRVRDITYNPPQWRWVDTQTLVRINVDGEIFEVLNGNGELQED